MASRCASLGWHLHAPTDLPETRGNPSDCGDNSANWLLAPGTKDTVHNAVCEPAESNRQKALKRVDVRQGQAHELSLEEIQCRFSFQVKGEEKLRHAC